jgi:GABA permease
VIRLVASSTESWEDAARAGVGEATKTIRDLASAKVTRLDTVVRVGLPPLYRVKLEMAFQVDRYRTTRHPSGAGVEVRRYLVVANETLSSPELIGRIEQLIAEGPAEFHVLVPSTHSSEYRAARRAAMMGDPLTGYVPLDVTTVVGGDEVATRQAEARLDDHMDRIAAAGADVTGEIGPADPMAAIARVLERSSFDGIVLSTLPAGLSKWLGMDLPSRIERSFDLPLVHVTTSGQHA